jgi:hypothetical protein
MVTLAEFAESAKPARRKCFTCRLPEDVLEQVENARLQETPVTFPVITAWLKDEGHENISMFNLRNHFQAAHHEDAR